jgi:uncharacterized membrane protein YphA (DoxX/SURF4 family)
MSVAVVLHWIASLLLIAEFVMAPINLWTGRTMPNFTKFTGLRPAVARWIFAPVKLVGAILVAIGLFSSPFALVGGTILGAVCALYLILLALPGRRDLGGIAAFAIGLVCATVVVVTT